MPTWGKILREFQDSAKTDGVPKSDEIRRGYLTGMSAHTGRNTILYATNFTQPVPADALQIIQINDEDMQGFMEVVNGLQGSSLDLILHSPGGNIEAAESIVTYLRSKFTDIRVFVPHLALSAATMIACSANRIVMGKHSYLGPIDPQLIMMTPLNVRVVPAQEILDQFDRAKRECINPANLPPWAPMLAQFGPDLLVKCDNLMAMSHALVEQWLRQYMLAGAQSANASSTSIAAWLCNHNEFKTHGRHIARDTLKARGLTVDDLEQDQQLQDLCLSVFHATTHTFQYTGCVKIIENQLGNAFVKILPGAVRGRPGATPTGPPPGPGQDPSGSLKQLSLWQRIAIAARILIGRV